MAIAEISIALSYDVRFICPGGDHAPLFQGAPCELNFKVAPLAGSAAKRLTASCRAEPTPSHQNRWRGGKAAAPPRGSASWQRGRFLYGGVGTLALPPGRTMEVFVGFCRASRGVAGHPLKVFG